MVEQTRMISEHALVSVIMEKQPFRQFVKHVRYNFVIH
jgi:hypothetical protein